MTGVGPGSTAMHLYGATPAARPSAAPGGPRSTEPASDQGRADMDSTPDVPEEIVDLAARATWEHDPNESREELTAFLAAFLPAHAAIVLRTATAEQCKDIIREATDQAMSERLAELEQGTRNKVSEEILALIPALASGPRTTCSARGAHDCHQAAGEWALELAAKSARGEIV